MTDHDEMTGCGDWTPPRRIEIDCNVLTEHVWSQATGRPSGGSTSAAVAIQISQAEQDHIAMLRDRSLLLAEQRGHLQVYRR